MECRVPCLLCGYLHRVIMTATVVVNKRSMRTNGVMLGGYQYARCPECGTPAGRDSSSPRTPYRLFPDSAANVAAYRLHRWGTGAAAGKAAS